MKDALAHYGMPRRSGRYPWGSGDIPYQRGGVDFLGRIEQLQKENPGSTEKDIANMLGMTINEMRDRQAISRIYRRNNQIAQLNHLIEKEGYSVNAAAAKMGIAESTARSLRNKDAEMRNNEVIAKAEQLKAAVEKKGIIDVGAGVERQLGVSDTKMQEAITLLYDRDGYEVWTTSIPQVTNPSQRTILNLLCPEGTTYAEAYEACKNAKVHNIEDFDSNGELIKPGKVLEHPVSIDSKRIKVAYAEDGGEDKDGLILVRRNVDDLNLGTSKYAQVRIAVDGTHYLKGMAAYSDDMPDGYDIVFNTNKHRGTPLLGEKNSVLKPFKDDDPDNPFGTEIKEGGQSYYTGKDGKKHLSAINKVNEEGDWGEWSKTLSSQFLSKQNIPLIKKQLNLSYADKNAEFDEIMSLNNPTIKKHYLAEFADECDSAATHLKAASLPRQRVHVILPEPSVKETEVYAPNYRNGEKLALIRYPHTGPFEIPIVTVNNKNAKAKALIGPDSVDAIVINKKTADRLSGADFDGDTVTTIPLSSKVKVTSTPTLKGLEGFDPKSAYPEYPGMKRMSKQQKGIEMGKVSNLITDMYLKGASDDELVKAVRHSMVVIDAEKHHLDYRKSEMDNDIPALRQKYQLHEENNPAAVERATGKSILGKKKTGPSTLISRANQDIDVLETRGTPYVDRNTGEVITKQSGRTYVNRKGETVFATEKAKGMSTVKDANLLSSGTPQEKIYADYANKMKAMANDARKEYYATPDITYSKSAAKTYSKEVSSLNAKLNNSLLNAPRERQAQVIAGNRARVKKEANPDMSDGAYKKIKNQELARARVEVGSSSKNRKIKITDSEWNAIQSGAITGTTLNKILNNTEADTLRARSMPRTTSSLSTAQQARIKAYKASGFTNQDIADQLGVSVSTVAKYGT
jgi:transposase